MKASDIFTAPSGVSGYSGYSAWSGISGGSAWSGISGWTGISGYTGISGISGWTGASGISGWSGARNTDNLIDNPDFNVWQRGTSIAAVANNAFCADRYRYMEVGDAVHTATADTDVPTAAESGHLSKYSLKLDCTTADSSIAAGDYVLLKQVIEGYDWLALAQTAMTLSFWVKAVKTGTYCVSFRNSGSDRSWVAEYAVNTTNTWEKKIINIDASPSAGTWDYTTGIGLQVVWALACGSTFQTTKDAWQTGNYYATSSQVNGVDSTDNNFFLSQVKLEVGTLASTTFAGNSYASDLAKCKRYLQAYGGTAAYERVGNGTIATSSIATIAINPPAQMRAAADVTYDAVGSWTIFYGSNAISTCTAIAVSNTSPQTNTLNCTVTGTPLTPGAAATLGANATTAARLYLSAEI